MFVQCPIYCKENDLQSLNWRVSTLNKFSSRNLHHCAKMVNFTRDRTLFWRSQNCPREISCTLDRFSIMKHFLCFIDGGDFPFDLWRQERSPAKDLNSSIPLCHNFCGRIFCWKKEGRERHLFLTPIWYKWHFQPLQVWFSYHCKVWKQTLLEKFLLANVQMILNLLKPIHSVWNAAGGVSLPIIREGESEMAVCIVMNRGPPCPSATHRESLFLLRSSTYEMSIATHVSHMHDAGGKSRCIKVSYFCEARYEGNHFAENACIFFICSSPYSI